MVLFLFVRRRKFGMERIQSVDKDSKMFFTRENYDIINLASVNRGFQNTTNDFLFDYTEKHVCQIWTQMTSHDFITNLFKSFTLKIKMSVHGAWKNKVPNVLNRNGQTKVI